MLLYINYSTMTKARKGGLSEVQSGGLLVNNLLGVGFFFGAATVSAAFFPLFLGYFISSGVHIYERKMGITDDVKSFLSHAFKV